MGRVIVLDEEKWKVLLYIVAAAITLICCLGICGFLPTEETDEDGADANADGNDPVQPQEDQVGDNVTTAYYALSVNHPPESNPHAGSSNNTVAYNVHNDPNSLYDVAQHNTHPGSAANISYAYNAGSDPNSTVYVEGSSNFHVVNNAGHGGEMEYAPADRVPDGASGVAAERSTAV